MVVAQRVDPATYETLAVGDDYRFVELRDGVLVEKPPVSVGHVWVIDGLVFDLGRQLDPTRYRVSAGGARLRYDDLYVIPDILVVPAEAAQALLERNRTGLSVYAEPMPLVIEVWSPSTGRYDVSTKIPLYRQRGDREIWFAHPVERTLTAWVRRDDGGYDEQVYRKGVIESAALPEVRIDLGTLFG